MCSGSPAIGHGMMRNPTSFGSVESGETFRRIDDGSRATGMPRVTATAGCREFGRKKRSSTLAICLNHLLRSIKAHQRTRLAKSTFMFQETGLIRTEPTGGMPGTGSQLLRTGSGFQRVMCGLPMVASISQATGTTRFKIVVLVSRPCSSLSLFTSQTTTATDRHSRST